MARAGGDVGWVWFCLSRGRVWRENNTTKANQDTRRTTSEPSITRVRARGERVGGTGEDPQGKTARVSTKGDDFKTRGGRGTRNGKNQKRKHRASSLNQSTRQSVSRSVDQSAGKQAQALQTSKPILSLHKGPPPGMPTLFPFPSNHKQAPPEKEWRATDGGGWEGGESRIEDRQTSSLAAHTSSSIRKGA